MKTAVGENDHACPEGRVSVSFNLNGVAREVDVEAGESLLSLLRRLGMRSVKEGCGLGECGACTVLVGGQAVRACLVFAARIQGAHVLTLEGLGTPNDLHPLQQAFLEVGAVQCGFCTPGILLVAHELLSRTPDPQPQEVRHALAGNLCRCTGYQRIVDGVMLAAQRRRGG